MARRRSRLTAGDVTGAWGIIPTPARADASDWRVEDTVDYAELARAVEAVVASGVDGILSLGTFGECATLTWEEKKKVMSTVVDVIAGRIPYFGGTTTPSTRQSIFETRTALDIGVDGTMLGVPSWCEMDTPQVVQFYRDVAEACPEAAICIYANTAAFKYAFPREFWGQVAEIPQVIMSKYLGVENMAKDLPSVKGRIRLLPVDNQYFAAAQAHPAECTAFWTSSAMMGPAPVIRLRDEVARAKASGDWSAAKTVSDEMAGATHGMVPNGDRTLLFRYNIPLEKERINAAGWINAGPCRPPYHINPPEYVEGARNTGRKWAALHAKYSEMALPTR